jgi:hypothetical protein
MLFAHIYHRILHGLTLMIHVSEDPVQPRLALPESSYPRAPPRIGPSVAEIPIPWFLALQPWLWD